MDVLQIIKKEHRAAAALLDRAVKLEPGDAGLGKLTTEIETALTTHVAIEERLLYARLRDRAEEEGERVDVFEAYTEHEVARHLIALLKSRRRRDERFKAELQVLNESIKHHVKEEESTVFALARELIDPAELEDLGLQWQKAKARPSRTAIASKKRR